MKRFWNLLQQDTQIMFRNKFHYAVILLAILFIVIIRFFVPGEVKMTPTELIADLTPTKFMEQTWREHGVNDDRFLPSEEALRDMVKQQKNSIGIIVEGTFEDPRFIILQQGHEPETSINYLKTSIEWSLGEIGAIEWPTVHEKRILRQEMAPIPFNQNLIPIFVVLEVVMVGFLLIAVMVFQEKGEGTIRAYRIAPGGVHGYILSKGLTNVLLSVVYGMLVVLCTLGFRVDTLNLLALIVLTSSFATFFGLMISVHFRNLSEFIFVAIVVMAVMSVPMGSYFFPAFTNGFVQLIPSYPVLFGLREVLFPTGQNIFLGSLYVSLIIANLVAYTVCYWACQRRLMKEVA